MPLTVKVPGGSCGETKVPSSLVVTVCETLPTGLTSVTVAPGTAAPFTSLTDPVIEPAPVCAETVA